MKTYLYRIIFLMLLVASCLTHSQIQPNNNNNNNRGEFLKLDSLKDLMKSCPTCPKGETELEDFSFDWGYNFNTAFNNLVLLEQAQIEGIKSWYRRQFEVIQDEIEKQINTSFNNYNDSKEAFFSDIEVKNITKNTPILLSKYKKLYNSGVPKNRSYLRELKSLQIREIELRAGNINNSQFPYLQVKGVLLKEITSLNMLSTYKSDIVNAFANQVVKNLEYKYTIEKLDYLGSSFERKMVRLKQEYYNRFSEWDKLGLMQFLLNYEHYKDIINCMVCILPDALLKFRNSDIATQPVIEEYAIKNRNKSLSIFDPRYPQVHRYQYQNNFCGGPIDFMAWEVDKQAALDGLLNDVSTIHIFADNLIIELNITDNSQKNWLYSISNSTEVSNLSDFLQNNRVHGVVAVEAMNFAKVAIEALKDGAEVDYEERIIIDSTFVNNPKAKCVYDKLKEAGGIKQILKGYFNEEETIPLKFKLVSNLSANCSSAATGCTIKTSDIYGRLKYVTIEIRENLINEFQWNNSGGIYQTPLLNISLVIIHEAIHANLYLALAQLNGGTLPPDSDFETLYEKYRNQRGWQHPFMAEHHLNAIANELEKVHPLLNDQIFIDYITNNYSDWTWSQIYKNMAWVGLTQTPAGIEYLSDPTNSINYSLQNTKVAVNSNKTQNCN